MDQMSPAHQRRDRNDVVIGMTIVIHHHHRQQDDQIDDVVISGGASIEGKAYQMIDLSVTSVGRTIGVGAWLGLEPIFDVGRRVT